MARKERYKAIREALAWACVELDAVIEVAEQRGLGNNEDTRTLKEGVREARRLLLEDLADS